jgi:hypothetical protein
VRSSRSGPSALDAGEFLIDTSVTYVPAPDDQWYPAVAFDGTNFLAVWTDRRFGTDDVFGARISQAGVVLDPDGIPVATGVGGQSSAAVAFDGANFLVAYQDYRDSFQICGIRVSPSGMVLDSAGFVICPGPRASFPSVASGTTNCLVVWQAYRSDTADIYGARVARDGTVLDPQGLALTRRAGDAWTPKVAFDGTNYLVVWNDDRNGYDDVFAARVTQAGAVLDPNGIPVCTAPDHQWSPSVAFGGGCCLVAWEDCRNEASDIYAARVSPTGIVLDPNGMAVCNVSSTQWFPSVAYDGVNFLIAWGDWRGEASVLAARVTPTGSILDPNGRRISRLDEYADYPRLTFGGANYLAAWVSGSSERDIRAARISTSCTPLDSVSFLVTSAANPQHCPSVASSATSYLAVWEDLRNGPTDIYGTRVSPASTVLDPLGIAVSTAAGYQGSPAVASDGTNFLVVWGDQRSGDAIYGARVNPQGLVLDPNGIAISPVANGQYRPAVTFDGTNFLVVWDDWRSGGDICGARVSQAGAVLDPDGIPISTAADWQYSPVACFDGTSFLVVWMDYRGGSGCSDIYGARVSQTGTVLDPEGIPVSTAANHQIHPVVSFDGTSFLAVWQDGRDGYWGIYGARVSQAGVVLDPDGVAISTATSCQESPAVSFDGTNWLVVWTDERSGSVDIWGARVTSSGTVLDEFPVITQEGNQYSPALARGSGSQMFLVYQGWAGTVSGKTYNTDRIWGKMDPNPGIEAGRQATAYSSRPTATIVRNVLFLPPSLLSAPSSLLSIDGRKVLDLHPGANDVSRLSPGVYFIQERSAVGGERSTVHKVVLTR